MIRFARWLRARRAAQHLGPVEWTLRPSGSTWVTLAALVALYGVVIVALGLQMGPIGLVVALIVALFEARTVVYEVDERVEIRGDVLVAHHHGRIEAFRREDVAQVSRDDYAGVPSYGRGVVNVGGLGSVAAILRIRTVEDQVREIWRCQSDERGFAVLDDAIDIIEIWRLHPSGGPAEAQGQPPSPFYRAPD